MEELPRILVVDDDPDILEIVRTYLERRDFQVITATSGEEVLSLAQTSLPDVILLDVLLPGFDGFELCRILKTNKETWRIPIILMTVRDDVPSAVVGLESGADDYVTKPFDVQEFIARIRAALRIKELQDRLKEAEEMTELLSTIDDLTALYNYRYFAARLRDEIERARRYKLDLSCLALEIDFFESLDESYGHQFGDSALKQVATILKNTVRSSDIVARRGLSSFIVLLPITHTDTATTAAERLRAELEHRNFGSDEHTIKISGSFGVTGLTEKDDSEPQTLLDRIEKALSRAKSQGGNCVVVL